PASAPSNRASNAAENQRPRAETTGGGAGGSAVTTGGRAGGTGGFSASAMKTAATRARSTQSRSASTNIPVCPAATTANRGPRSETRGAGCAAAGVAATTGSSAARTASLVGQAPSASTATGGNDAASRAGSGARAAAASRDASARPLTPTPPIGYRIRDVGPQHGPRPGGRCRGRGAGRRVQPAGRPGDDRGWRGEYPVVRDVRARRRVRVDRRGTGGRRRREHQHRADGGDGRRPHRAVRREGHRHARGRHGFDQLLLPVAAEPPGGLLRRLVL